jgi:predicted amidohydrolase YtcJ
MSGEGFYADLVLLNGKIVTVDAEDSLAKAVALKGNRIVAVGPEEDVSRWIGEETEVIDLNGKTVLPGLIDSHMHPGSYGAFKVRGVQCGPDLVHRGASRCAQGKGRVHPQRAMGPRIHPRRREARAIPDTDGA